MSDVIAFMGSGRKESISIYVAASGVTTKIAPREVDYILSNYTEAELSTALLETRFDETELLYVHLPDVTLVYDKDVSNMIGVPVWYFLSNVLDEESVSTRRFEGLKKYNARNMVKCYNKWIVGDPDSTNIGYLSKSIQSMYGDPIRWAFNTIMLYNEGKPAIIRELELVGTTGRQADDTNPAVYTRYSYDGLTYSQKRRITLGNRANRSKRMVWINQGTLENFRIQEFTGMSDAMASFMRLEMKVEGLFNYQVLNG
jgi:hypothetical protein